MYIVDGNSIDNSEKRMMNMKCVGCSSRPVYSLKLQNTKGSVRAIIAASLAALSMNGVYASNLAPVPQTVQSNTNSNIDSSSVQNIKTEGNAYTLTKLQEGGSKPSGDNIVTKFVYNSQTGAMTPVYYRMDLKQTAYGKGDTTKYYGWTNSDNGNKTFGEVPQADADIEFSYNTPSSLQERVDYSSTKIDKISGDFVGQSFTNGGAINLNRAEVNEITANFINNTAVESAGAIYNYDSSDSPKGISAITGNFVGNNVQNSNGYSGTGGAIYNNNKIGSIKGDFIGNYVKADSQAIGGAIANWNGYYGGSIGNIVGDFIGNYTESKYSSYGGALANRGLKGKNSNISGITGDFIGNHSTTVDNGKALGGAIYNLYGNITGLNGNFIGNYAQGEVAQGGAIYNYSSTISNITGDFINNYASGIDGAQGGAIYNNVGTILGQDTPLDKVVELCSQTAINVDTGETITVYWLANTEGSDISINSLSDLIAQGYKLVDSNYEDMFLSDEEWDSVQSNLETAISSGFLTTDNPAQGLSQDNFVKYLGIEGDFIGNHAVAKNGSAEGGAVYTSRYQMGPLAGDFIANYANGKIARGGAIYNYGTSIAGIEGDFIGNYVSGENEASGGAIANVMPDGVKEYSLNNLSSINYIKGDFVNNHAKTINGSALGGAITNAGGYDSYYRLGTPVIGKLSGNFVGNYVKSENGSAAGGAIYNNVARIDNIENSSFINNYAISKNGSAKGGAIYSGNDLNISAKDGYTSVFSGNYVENNGKRESNAIFMDSAIEKTTYGTKFKPTNLTLSATDNGAIIMNDKISGQNVSTTKAEEINTDTQYSVHLEGDKTGTIQLNNDVDAINGDGTKGSVNIDLSDVTLHLGVRDNVIDNNNLVLNSGTLNMVNNQVGVAALNSLAVHGDTNMVADVDLANQTMDRITANEYGEHKGNINVVGMNLLSDAPAGRDVTDIYFAQTGLKDYVNNGTGELPDGYQTTAYTPIYKYNVMYDNREDGGYFTFTRGAGSAGGGNPSDIYNPAILSSPVAAQAGAYAAQNAAFSYAFAHADAFMPLPSADRFALRHANQYAIASYDNLSMQMNDLHERGMWVRPYTSFESIPLKNGPDVDTITYGTLIGGDSDFKELKHGWGTVFTGYVGYNGSSQHYSGVDTYQNGGLLGATQTFYKGNFFTALTASVGASAGESHNMYGTDNFAMLMAGIASKSGYNLEFKDGRFIIQPSLMLSYSFINTFDYKTASGVNMDSDPMHALQINPNVKFIANLKNGWQPYASVGMVWNLLDGTNVRANTVRLPEMSIKPYVEYGVGIQKRWKDKYTGFLQAMVRNGGRNGVALTGGFRWSLGKEGKPVEKVQNIEKKPTTLRLSCMDNNSSSVDTVSQDKYIIKQLNPSAKTALQSGRKIIKQLSPAQRTALGVKPQNTTMTTSLGVFKSL